MTSYAAGTPNWVDLGTDDASASARFYHDLFGWEVEELGPQAGNYTLLRKDGQQVGGISPMLAAGQPPSWSTYFATNDAAQTADRVREHGGLVSMTPTDVMGRGMMAAFTDPEGAYFSVWQPGSIRGAELTHAPGSMTWVELMTSDISTAKSFYEAVLPVSTRDVPIDDQHTYTLLETGSPLETVAGAMEMTPDMMTPGQAGMPPHWSIFFEVEDTDATAERAERLGATDVHVHDSSAGRYATVTDPRGASFSIIRSDPEFAM